MPLRFEGPPKRTLNSRDLPNELVIFFARKVLFEMMIG